jgi:hypothetical protein
MHDTALTEVKALLTLALLKSGTSGTAIQTAIDVAATTRLMAGEEGAESAHDERHDAEDNVTNVRDLRHGNAAAEVRDRRREQPISALNGDVKALLSLLLLQHGATSREILTTLRMAAGAHRRTVEQNVQQHDEQTGEQEREQTEVEQPAEVAAAPIAPKPITQKPVVLRPEMLPADIRPASPKQRLRNEYLAPIERSPHAA